MPGRPRNPRLRKPLSLQIIKAWLELLDEAGTRWTYWDVPQQSLTDIFDRHQINECIALTPPYLRSRSACETFLRTSERYLSQSDLDENIWVWADGDSAPVRMKERLEAFLAQEHEGVKSLITEKSKNLLCMLEFMGVKQTLGEAVHAAHEQFMATYHQAIHTRDRIIREECSKAQGIEDIKTTLTAIRILFEKCKTFFSREPGQEAYEGAILSFGLDPFEDALNNQSLEQVLQQVGVLSPRVMLHVRANVGDIQDEHPFCEFMETLLEENVRVSKLNVVREEKNRERSIKAKALLRDVKNLKEELKEYDDNSWSISVIKDYIDQLQDFKRRLSHVQAMEEVEVAFPELSDTIIDEDGGVVTSKFSFQEWLLFKKRNLLTRKDQLEATNREDETKRKMLLQDALRSSNRQKIQKLQKRKHFLAWQIDYTKTKESLRSTGLPNWRMEVVKLAKESLSLETDVKNTLMITTLKEFESYIRATYLSSTSLMTDLFEDIFSTGRPTNIEESSSRITEVLNIIRLTKTKEIYSKVAEEHIEKILVYCLIRRDYNEFMIEWAKTKTDHMLENSLLDESDEDEGLDFEKTITEQVMQGSLEKKRNFMVKFLERKSTELGNRKASQRALNIDSRPVERTSIRVKTGDRVFRIQIPTPSGGDESDSPDEGQEKMYVGQLIDDKTKPTAKKSAKSKFPPKECATR